MELTEFKDFMRGKEKYFVGIGTGTGEKKIEEAVERALNMIEADDASQCALRGNRLPECKIDEKNNNAII